MKEHKNLFEKIWDSHVVAQEKDSPTLLYIDLQLIHEVTSPQAFTGLKEKGLAVRKPEKTVATTDHSTPTIPAADSTERLSYADEECRKQIAKLEENCHTYGISLHGLDSPTNGIVHVIGPELGLTQPGMTIVCGDSHTSTHGAFGALAFGIGTSEVEQVLATQCLLQHKPKTMEIRIEGTLAKGVTAKDVILHIINTIGVGGGVGYVIEYTGSLIRSLNMDQRMTICNMSIEAGARAGMIAPDDTTIQYLADRPFSPKGVAWENAVRYWKILPSDPQATYDKSIIIDVSALEPVITFGTNPGMSIPITGKIPSPEKISNADAKANLEKALHYMGFNPNQSLLGHPINTVFIGSCTNSRLTDLREASKIFEGRKVAPGVRVLVVPGSNQIKKQAEAEGLHTIFLNAGAEWREPGCSMCIAMNGDQLAPGEYAVSTSNRNFEGRQGKGGRTLLASPLTAAAAAVTGVITDPRTMI